MNPDTTREKFSFWQFTPKERPEKRRAGFTTNKRRQARQRKQKRKRMRK